MPQYAKKGVAYAMRERQQQEYRWVISTA